MSRGQFPSCDSVSLSLGLSFPTCDCVSLRLGLSFPPVTVYLCVWAPVSPPVTVYLCVWASAVPGCPSPAAPPSCNSCDSQSPCHSPHHPGSCYSHTPAVETGWEARWGLRGWSPVSSHLLGCMAPGRDPQALVAGSGPGLYALPSTVGYINHDCTRVAGPAYSLFRRPSEGKAGVGEVGLQSPTQSISSPP